MVLCSFGRISIMHVCLLRCSDEHKSMPGTVLWRLPWYQAERACCKLVRPSPCSQDPPAWLHHPPVLFVGGVPERGRPGMTPLPLHSPPPSQPTSPHAPAPAASRNFRFSDQKSNQTRKYLRFSDLGGEFSTPFSCRKMGSENSPPRHPLGGEFLGGEFSTLFLAKQGKEGSENSPPRKSPSRNKNHRKSRI